MVGEAYNCPLEDYCNYYYKLIIKSNSLYLLPNYSQLFEHLHHFPQVYLEITKLFQKKKKNSSNIGSHLFCRALASSPCHQLAAAEKVHNTTINNIRFLNVQIHDMLQVCHPRNLCKS